VILLSSTILNWPTNYLFGLFASGVLAYFLLCSPLRTLLVLIVIRMFLDYPSEEFSISFLNTLELSYSQTFGMIIALAAKAKIKGGNDPAL